MEGVYSLEQQDAEDATWRESPLRSLVPPELRPPSRAARPLQPSLPSSPLWPAAQASCSVPLAFASDERVAAREAIGRSECSDPLVSGFAPGRGGIAGGIAAVIPLAPTRRDDDCCRDGGDGFEA